MKRRVVNAVVDNSRSDDGAFTKHWLSELRPSCDTDECMARQRAEKRSDRKPRLALNDPVRRERQREALDEGSDAAMVQAGGTSSSMRLEHRKRFLSDNAWLAGDDYSPADRCTHETYISTASPCSRRAGCRGTAWRLGLERSKVSSDYGTTILQGFFQTGGRIGRLRRFGAGDGTKSESPGKTAFAIASALSRERPEICVAEEGGIMAVQLPHAPARPHAE